MYISKCYLRTILNQVFMLIDFFKLSVPMQRHYDTENIEELNDFLDHLHSLNAMGTATQDIFVEILLNENTYKTWTGWYNFCLLFVIYYVI